MSPSTSTQPDALPRRPIYPRPKPDSIGPALRAAVAAHLAQQGDHRYANAALWGKAAALALLAALLYAASLASAHVGVFVAGQVLALLCGMMLASNVLHDAAHRAFSPHPTINRAALWLTSVPMGVNAIYWQARHVNHHHAHPHVEGWDLDIEPNPFLRQTPFHTWAPQYQWQHRYWPVIAALSLPYLCWYSDWLDQAGHTPKLTLSEPRPSWPRFVLDKLLHAMLWLAVPMWALHSHGLPLAWGVLSYLLGLCLASMLLVMAILGTHWSDVQFYRAPTNGVMPHDWFAHSFYTCCDWRASDRSAWLDACVSGAVGGLDRHLTHHLLPTISHRHYRALAPIVAELAAAHGLPYRCLTYAQLWSAQKRFLKSLGQRPTTPRKA